MVQESVNYQNHVLNKLLCFKIIGMSEELGVKGHTIWQIKEKENNRPKLVWDHSWSKATILFPWTDFSFGFVPF